MEHNDTPTFEVVGLVRFAQVPKWIVRHPALSVGAKALYADIMTYADNETRAAFPGRERMAEDLNVSVSTIGRYIKELESAGVVAVTRRRNRRTGNFYANHYCLRWSEPEVTSDTRRARTSDTITTPTVLPTLTVNPDAVTSVSDDLSPMPAVETTADHSVKTQIGVSKEQKDQLVDMALRIYGEGVDEWDSDLWSEFAVTVEDVTGVFVSDYIADKRFSERLGEVIEANLDRGPRYGASAWLGTLVNTARWAA